MLITMKTIFHFINLIVCIHKIIGSSTVHLQCSQSFTTTMDISTAMIESCFANESLVIPIESKKDGSDEFIKNIYLKNENDIILIDDSTIARSVDLKTKGNVFIIPINSASDSKYLLRNLKRSPYWDHMGLFMFINDDSSSNRSSNCNNAKYILKSAWHMNIQSSLFICIDDNNTPMIFTSNPFTKRAPAPWKQIESQSEEHWTLYSQRYDKDLLCNTLNYKRDEALDEYPVRFFRFHHPNDDKMLQRGLDYSVEQFQSFKLNRLPSSSLKLVSALSENLNVSSFISTEQNKNFTYFLNRSLHNQQPDVTFSLLDSIILKNTSFLGSTPVYYSSYAIYSHKQGYFSPLEKICNFFGIITIISMSVVLTITFFVILIIKKHSVSFAGFEILRLIINSSLLVRMETISIRIFFAVVFLYFLIIQALFQGNLSKFLTKPSTKPNINSLEDLNNPNIHKVYVAIGLNKSDEFTKRIKPFNHKVSYVRPAPCIENVIQNKHAACIAYPIFQADLPANLDIHIGRGIFPYREVYITRNDWPLIERLDSSIVELHENGFLDYHRKTALSKSKFNEEKNEAMLKVQGPRAISMSDISFAFVILFIGLSLSFIVFLSEINLNENSNNKKRKIATKKRRHV